MFFLLYSFFFFKQKTAYEMRISDWSSDVCSSDLFVGGDFIGVGIAGLDIGALQPCEMAAGRASIARPCFEAPGVSIFGERGAGDEAGRFWAGERPGEQTGIVSPLASPEEHQTRHPAPALRGAVKIGRAAVRGQEVWTEWILG